MEKKFRIYENMDAIDPKALMEAATGKAEVGAWPKNSKYQVTVDGREYTVNTYFTQAGKKVAGIHGGQDAYRAIMEMKTKEEVTEEYKKFYPNSPYMAEISARAEFSNKTPYLDKEKVAQRLDFIRTVAILINNPETMQVIASCAEKKKKTGELYKKRLLKIACSGLAAPLNTVWALTAEAKNESTLSITFDERLVHPQKADVWNDDFISNYHEGLPISEALKKILSD